MAMLQDDVRLMQLKLNALEAIMRSKGVNSSSSSSSVLQDSSVLSGVAGSSVQQVQQQPAMHTAYPQHAAAVVGVLVQHWQAMLQERLQAAQMLLPDVPLSAPPKTQAELDAMQAPGSDAPAWRQIGHKHSPWVAGIDAAPACIKLLYAAEDLLEALTTPVAVAPCRDDGCCHCSDDGDASSQHHNTERPPLQLTLVHAVHVPNRVWLQSFFAELQPERRQIGIDDVLHSWYSDQQVQQARSIAASCSAAACRAAARTGCPASERPWMWAAALGIPACPPNACSGCEQQRPGSEGTVRSSGCNPASCQHTPDPAGATLQDTWWALPTPRDTERLQQLCSAVKQQTLLADVLTCADVQQTADSARFFVFEEAMRAVLLAFSRDASVMRQAASTPTPVLTAATGDQQQPAGVYPPSGVLPFQGLSAFLAPVCYLYSSPAAVYPVWHAMYCQHWCRLHALNCSSAPAAGLAVLCRTFLDLLQEVDLEVYHHLGTLTPTPLDMVFPWLMTAFASHLAPAETLLLWDRVIGFDSLLPPPSAGSGDPHIQAGPAFGDRDE